MKVLHTFGKILTGACIIFTVLIFILYTAGMVISDNAHSWIPTLSSMYMLFLFSLVLSMANRLVLHTKLHAAFKLIIHYFISIIIFYILFFTWGHYEGSISTVFVILLLFTILYAIAAIIYAVIASLTSSVKNKKSEYSSQFKN